MTPEQLREKVLELIRGWLRDEKVRGDETAVLVLNNLAGDIEVLNLSESVASPVPAIEGATFVSEDDQQAKQPLSTKARDVAESIMALALIKRTYQMKDEIAGVIERAYNPTAYGKLA